MARPELQKWIVEKCFKEHQTPFERQNTTLTWMGDTRVKSKQTGRVYPVHIEIHIEPERRIADQLQACLCRSEGVRIQDLEIAHMLSPRLRGEVHITGLPSKDIKTDFSKFVKQITEVKTES